MTPRERPRLSESFRSESPPDAGRAAHRTHKHTRNAQDACKEYALKTDTKQSAWSGATHLQKRTSKHAQLQRRLTSTAR